MIGTFELRLTSDAQLLSVMREAVGYVCTLAGFSPMHTSKIVLALDEACSNIIKHAYKGRGGQPIIIVCRLKRRSLEFILLDEGEPADVKKIKSRPLHEIRPGGLGVYLINSVMDKVKYTAGRKVGNRLYMKIWIPKDVKS